MATPADDESSQGLDRPPTRASTLLRLVPVGALILVGVLLLLGAPIFPAFVVGPLGLLLLLSRPRTRREWIWIAGCASVVVLWFLVPDSFSERTVRAAGVCYIAALGAVTVAGVASLTSRALLAAGIATVATAGWFVAFHLRFADLQRDVALQSWNASRAMSVDLPASPPPISLDVFRDPGADVAHRMAAAVAATASLYPGLLALTALLATWLASVWYSRIATRPIAAAVPAFSDFRFNDHLIWGLVVPLAVMLLPLPTWIGLAGANVLLVMSGLYWMRGVAILVAALRRARLWVIGILVLVLIPMAAIVLVGLTLLGVADTWIDFRRRLAPPTGVTP